MDESHPSHNREIPNGGISNGEIPNGRISNGEISNVGIPNAVLANIEVIIHFSLLMARRNGILFLKF